MAEEESNILCGSASVWPSPLLYHGLLYIKSISHYYLLLFGYRWNENIGERSLFLKIFINFVFKRYLNHMK